VEVGYALLARQREQVADGEVDFGGEGAPDPDDRVGGHGRVRPEELAAVAWEDTYDPLAGRERGRSGRGAGQHITQTKRAVRLLVHTLLLIILVILDEPIIARQ
jgi:hypothetical protein